jgi:hypothetical protein
LSSERDGRPQEHIGTLFPEWKGCPWGGKIRGGVFRGRCAAFGRKADAVEEGGIPGGVGEERGKWGIDWAGGGWYEWVIGIFAEERRR